MLNYEVVLKRQSQNRIVWVAFVFHEYENHMCCAVEWQNHDSIAVQQLL